VNQAPVVRDVVLVGGGHSHALLIRRWAMRPLPGVRLTLVSDGVCTPYSGMLPGLIAGHYRTDEVHIDLMRLCLWAGVRFIDARMTGLDPRARTVELQGRPSIGYDRLSLDTGSTPDLSVPGADRYATPVKPVHDFVQRWRTVRERLPPAGRSAAASADDDGTGPFAIGVVGSGAGGFEILMAVHHALADRSVSLHWFLRDRLPLAGRHRSARRAGLRAAIEAGVTVHTGFDVERVTAGPVLGSADGRQLALDELLWCTGATGPDWPGRSGLAIDRRGFVLTDPTLRSTSHPEIYATGDIGTRCTDPHPKAGVHAVRQAPVLHDNLRADLLGEPLRPYRPQRDFLSLMATGPRHAIASRGPVTVSGAWVWRWKDRIDRRFMQRFEHLPAMASSGVPGVLPNALRGSLLDASSGQGDPAAPTGPRCRGCGAKVGSDVLREALQRHADHHSGEPADDRPTVERSAEQQRVLQGLEAALDVSIISPGSALLVQSVDQLSALFDDPWRFARIATLHALSDVLTVAARPHSALLVLTMPPAGESVQRRELSAVLDGVGEVLSEHGVRLIGGHTAEGPQLQIALTINALAEVDALADVGTDAAPARSRARAGDALLLTRPIGVGVLFAGAMHARARGRDLITAIERMERSSAAVADCLREQGARCLTDVTGFGLAGHLERLLDGADAVARVRLSDVPILPGAHALAAAGVHSSLFDANRPAVARLGFDEAPDRTHEILLADPQTAGGLLAVLPAERAAATLRAVREFAPEASLIGTLESPAACASLPLDPPVPSA